MQRVLILLAVISVSMAAVYIRELEPIPDEFAGKEGCYIREIPDVISIGSRVPDPKACQEYICSKDYVQIATCGAVSAEPPYEVVPGDPTLPYNKCCDQIVLKQQNDNVPETCAQTS